MKIESLFLVLFLTSNEDVKSEYLKHLKYTICGAAPLGELDEERFLTKAGKHLNIFQGEYAYLYAVQIYGIWQMFRDRRIPYQNLD